MRDSQNVSNVQGECAWLEVPENWDAPGKAIKLRIARVRAQGRAKADPLVMIPGGPGQGAVESFAPMIGALAEVLRTRDVILVDPRGTGESAPLTCEVQGEDAGAILKCVDKLTGDPRQYHTDNEVRDYEAVRKALGVARWNAYGGSYGTRVALNYMHAHPDALRRVVLDGVVPDDVLLGTTNHLTGEAALHALEARGASGLVEQLLELKKKEPRVPDLVRLALYSPEASALLPLAVKDERVRQNLAKLVQTSVEKVINPLLSFTVGCREDLPFVKTAPAPTPFFGYGTANIMRDVCAKWPADKASERRPTPSDVPALLLSGALDPVTPPEFGERALKMLSHGQHLVVPGTGHITFARGCVPHLIKHFLDEETIDAKCLEPLEALPVFATVNGP